MGFTLLRLSDFSSVEIWLQLPRHNLTVEGVWPGLFVDQSGTYWSVPSSVNVDLASDGFDSGLNYHVCIQHNGGTPKRFASDQNNGASPPILQPGLCIKSAFSLKKDADIWRAKSGKLRMVQPYDIFLSDPHVQLSGVIGMLAYWDHHFECAWFNALFYIFHVHLGSFEVIYK